MSKADPADLERALAELLGSSPKTGDSGPSDDGAEREFLERLRACEAEVNANDNASQA